MALVFHSSLSKDLSLILNDNDDFNVIIQVGENRDMKEFHAHSVILRARSPYFKSAFSTKWITKKDNMIVFHKPNISPTIFEMVLKYIYTGEIDLTNRSGEDILGLLVASDELFLEELFKHLQDYLIKKRSTWVQRNFDIVLYTVFKLPSCKKLQDYYLEFICENPQPFLTSEDFLSLDKDILYDLFKRNDLQIEESVAWDCLIKWGIEQTPYLESDRVKWSVEDYEALKETLSRFIPLIRFSEFSHNDFYDKVRPYKDIIPSHIYEEVEEFYFKDTLPSISTLPSRTVKFESNIIKPKLANIISNWIDRKNFGTRYNSNYKFNLIYRGSRDGISSESFRECCNGQVASLVLIKVQQSDKIFGGYSSIGFSSIGSNLLFYDNNNCWLFYYSSDNFIFSFENSEDTKDMKISRVVNDSKAILDHLNNGFNFGWASLSMNGQDLYVNNRGNNYENNIRTDVIFTIEEIETFIVIKR